MSTQHESADTELDRMPTNNKKIFWEEISYKKGATELFLAIEEMEWRDAFDIIASDPGQAQTWVNNSGAGVFVNCWRRLPIHEACIKRAPAWLVSELLSAFPESTSMTTNHGEYPLHLAVDKACAPEVVNLIIVANWNAIVARDQAGRTPLDILNHAELLEIDGNKVIFESLQRCHNTYMELQNISKNEKAALVRKQKAQSCVISKRHQEENRKHQTKNAKLTKEKEQLKKELDSAKEQIKNQNDDIEKHNEITNNHLKNIKQLEEKAEDQKREIGKERTQIKALMSKLEQREKEIKRKNTKIDCLSKDLQNIVMSNETEILESLVDTEQSMRIMVSAQIALQQQLKSRSEGLKAILEQRGIAMPEIHKPVEEKEEEKSLGEEEEKHVAFAIQDVDASAAMMKAATAALNAMA